MARKIKKWSEMLEEIQSRRSRVYREGCKFVYDSGYLPDGLIGVAPGTVLALQRPHGITALQMPGNAEDWIVIGGGSGGGGGVSITIDSSLSSTSTNPVQNKAVKAALDGKMPADQAFKTINGQSIKGSGNITPDSSLSSSSTNPVQNKVITDALASKVDKVSNKGLSTNDFTTALKNKLSALPVISISGNTLTIDGQQFTLTPAGGGGESTAKDYFIGWTTGSKSDFAALTAAQLQALATGYSTAQNPTYTGQFGQSRIFFLLYKSAPQRIVLTSSGQEMVQNIESDNTCPHDPVTIDGTTFQLFGIFASSNHDPSDSMTITF
jgi:hypothetical protein